ncbi:hypothetical protein MKK50_18170 [Methylobacterium sp. J-043]|nr:hypothetical protein [Methylobacterium sp. J-043]
MAGFGLSQALGLIAGSPLAKAGSVIAEKLPVTKSMGLGGIGGLLSQVMQDGNLSSIMQNPVAAIAGQVQAQVQGAVAQVQAALGGAGAGLVNALSGAGGIGEAVGALKAAGDHLSGLGADPQGFFDLVAHGNMAGMLGDGAPPAMSYARAAGPVTSAPTLAETQALIDDTVQQSISGALDPDAAAATSDSTRTRCAPSWPTAPTPLPRGRPRRRCSGSLRRSAARWRCRVGPSRRRFRACSPRWCSRRRGPRWTWSCRSLSGPGRECIPMSASRCRS